MEVIQNKQNPEEQAAERTPIVVSDLCKYYETKAGKVAALDHISFTVADGDFVGIVGKSGQLVPERHGERHKQRHKKSQ